MIFSFIYSNLGYDSSVSFVNDAYRILLAGVRSSEFSRISNSNHINTMLKIRCLPGLICRDKIYG